MNPSNAILTQDTWISARDGRRLAATKYIPVTPNNRIIIINGATAVKRIYYDRYARFLAENGFDVLTYDYRGIGGSIEGHICGETSNMRQWGEIDIASAIDYVTASMRNSQLLVVGHSSGGQLLGLADNNIRVSAMLTVSAQSGYWRHWRGAHRWGLAVLWYGLMPGITGLCSYFPAKPLGLGENLPGGVAREWARWCRHSDYLVDERGQPLRQHFSSYHGNILSYVISDDWMAPQAAVEALMELYSLAKVEIRVIGPDNTGKKSIGHFGFFRESSRPLWQESIEWLSKQ